MLELIALALSAWAALMSTAVAVTLTVQAFKRRRKPLIDADWLKSLGLPKLMPWQRNVLKDLARHGQSPTGRTREGPGVGPMILDETHEFTRAHAKTIGEPDQWHPDVTPSPEPRAPKHSTTETTATIPRVPGDEITDHNEFRTWPPGYGRNAYRGVDPLTHAVRSGTVPQADETRILPNAGKLAAQVRAEYDRQPVTPPKGTRLTEALAADTRLTSLETDQAWRSPALCPFDSKPLDTIYSEIDQPTVFVHKDGTRHTDGLPLLGGMADALLTKVEGQLADGTHYRGLADMSIPRTVGEADHLLEGDDEIFTPQDIRAANEKDLYEHGDFS